MSESKIFFRLIQATNMYKHISRNIGATMTAYRKLIHDNFFEFCHKKNLLFQKINCITIKKGYSCKSLH